MSANPVFPEPVGGLLEDRMWQSIAQRAMQLPYCADCNRAVYPPSSCCPRCMSFELPWRPISGRGRILSWTRFHRTYLPAYPAPHTVIAVALEEGVVMISNLAGPEPSRGEWIGRNVRICYENVGERLLPRFELDPLPSTAAPA